MAKNPYPNRKLLLVQLSTNRDVEGEERRVKFAANSVVDLTDDELELFDTLTVKTGKLHYRDPIREGGDVEVSEPEVVVVPDFAGQDVAFAKKNVDQLKAYLTFHEVGFDNAAKKDDLLALAEKNEAAIAAAAAATGGGAGDPDAGL